MKIHEASYEITEGGILFPCLKTSYMEPNTQKDEETFRDMTTHSGALEHGPCASSIDMLPEHAFSCIVLRNEHTLFALKKITSSKAATQGVNQT